MIWKFIFLFTGLFIAILDLHMLWRFWNWFVHYKIPRLFAMIFSPLGFTVAFYLIIESAKIERNEDTIVPLVLIKYFIYILYSLLLIALILFFIYRPHNWINRRKFWFNRKFGPYIIPGKDAATEMFIVWGARSRYGRVIKSAIEKTTSFAIGEDPGKLISLRVLLSENPELLSKIDDPASSEIGNRFRIETESFKIEIGDTRYVRYILLKNLKPDTKYFYLFPITDEIFSFRTADVCNRDRILTEPLKFAGISDLHASGVTVAKTVRLIKDWDEDISFVVSCGDNVSDGNILTHWRTFFGQMAPVLGSVPFISSTGNHDGHFWPSALIWRELFPYPYTNPDEFLYYSVKFFPIHLFVIDLYNLSDNRKNPIPVREQISVLEREMARSDCPIKILIMHNSIYTTGDFGCNPHLERIFLPLIEKYRIPLVLTGHSHLFEAFYRPFSQDLNTSSFMEEKQSGGGIKNNPIGSKRMDAEGNIISNDPPGTLFLVIGGGGARLDYCVLRRFYKTPYLWKGKVHIAKERPFLKGMPRSIFRNDEFVLKYQDIGMLVHHVAFFTIQANENNDFEINVEIKDWDRNIIYRRVLFIPANV